MTAEVDNSRSMVYNSFMNDYKAPELKIIAHAENAFTSSFAVPRQSGLVKNVTRIVFEPEFCKEGILNGIDEFSHLWILWLFSGETGKQWSPTVRPPKLGGNKRKGVFATRSPLRPNPVGLSSVRLLSVCSSGKTQYLEVEGADLINGTPIIDVKPYVPYCDCHSDASMGFADGEKHALDVVFSPDAAENLPKDLLRELKDVLSLDPRPGYQHDENKVYKFEYGNFTLSFSVKESVLTVLSANKND